MDVEQRAAFRDEVTDPDGDFEHASRTGGKLDQSVLVDRDHHTRLRGAHSAHSPTLRTTRTNAPLTAIVGTNGWWPIEPVMARWTTMEYTKVETNTPRENWMVRSRRNPRSTRGENCPLVSCSTTIVIENTRPVKAIIAWVIEDKKLLAPDGDPE